MKNKVLWGLTALLVLNLYSCQPGTDSAAAVLSSNAGISSLTINDVAQSTTGGTTRFAVAHEIDTVTIVCVPAAGATIAVGGVKGTRFEVSDLIVGGTTITITVTAEDGVTTKTYTVIVTRSEAGIPVLTYPADGAMDVEALPTLAWGESLGAVNWKLYFGDGTVPPDIPVYDSSDDYYASPRTWTPPKLSPSLAYAWKVVPYDSAGKALDASVIGKFTTGKIPAAPASLKVTANAANSLFLDLAWSASVHAESYKVFRNGTLAYTAPGSAVLTWTDGSPNSGELNTYAVVATNSFGDSVASDTASGTPAPSGSAVLIFQ
jgi:hypothetical protein